MDTIKRYFELAEERPELFSQSVQIPLVLEENMMRDFAEETGKKMGMVYDNSPFFYVVADLCRGKKGLFSYARVIYCNARSNGAVAIPRCGDFFGLLSIYRHAPRCDSLEFPRGFAETGELSSGELIQRELSEELGLKKEECSIRKLGNLRADAGLSAGLVQIFLADISPEAKIDLTDEEGIFGFRWVTEETLRSMIADGRITDGFTISSYGMLTCTNS